MRPAAVFYLVGMAFVVFGERIIGGADNMRWLLDGVGVVAFLVAIGLMVRELGSSDTERQGAIKAALCFCLLGLVSLLVGALSSDAALSMLGFSDEVSEDRFAVLIGGLWPILWLVGTLPFLVIDRVLAANPVQVVRRRALEAGFGAVALALAFAWLFPLNYLASQHNQRWDFGYFKTAQPGTSTVALVENLEDPIHGYMFFPVASDVTDEIRTYFDQLNTGLLTYELVDHALEPELAKDLKVRDNGYLVFVKGDGDERQIEKVKVGVTFDKAKRQLKQLDSEVQGALLKLARGQRVAYFTMGHGEYYWKSDEEMVRRISNLKKMLSALNYKVKELGLPQGLGNEVPEDADMVAIVGPETAFMDEEVIALNNFRDQGGSILIALEPDGPDFAGLLAPLGIEFDGQGNLANDSKFLTRNQRVADRINVFTNKYGTHESVTTLSRNSKVLYLVTPGAGALTENKGAVPEGGSVTVTVRSLSDSWMDMDGDLKFDEESEKRQPHTIAMAASGPTVDGSSREEYRVVVVSDATWATDLALPADPSNGNFQFFMDTTNWLVGDDANSGTVNSEEDVKIQHTKEGQGWWFYATSFILPFGLFFGGVTRVRLRKKRGMK